MTKTPSAVLGIVAAALLAAPLAASAGLLGSSVTGTPYWPDLFHLGGTGHSEGPITVDAGIEFPVAVDATHGILYSGDIDITNTQILWIPTSSDTYLTNPFNGFGLKFFGAPAITNVVLNSASAPGVTSISFTADEILLNFSGQTVVRGQAVIFDVNPVSVPEPATLALLSLGLAGLGFSRRKQ